MSQWLGGSACEPGGLWVPILVKTTCLGCRFDPCPKSGCVQEQSMNVSISHGYFSLLSCFLSPQPPSLVLCLKSSVKTTPTPWVRIKKKNALKSDFPRLLLLLFNIYRTCQAFAKVKVDLAHSQ